MKNSNTRKQKYIYIGTIDVIALQVIIFFFYTFIVGVLETATWKGVMGT